MASTSLTERAQRRQRTTAEQLHERPHESDWIYIELFDWPSNDSVAEAAQLSTKYWFRVSIAAYATQTLTSSDCIFLPRNLLHLLLLELVGFALHLHASIAWEQRHKFYSRNRWAKSVPQLPPRNGRSGIFRTRSVVVAIAQLAHCSSRQPPTCWRERLFINIIAVDYKYQLPTRKSRVSNLIVTYSNRSEL